LTIERSGQALHELVTAIVTGDDEVVSRLLSASPALARASFHTGASRETANAFFIDPIGRYIWAGDTALHIAAAAHRAGMVQSLIAAGANVRAKNRLGDEALHAAAAGQPGSPAWNPSAQEAAIRALIGAGADPNGVNRSGTSPLHRAVRTRCAAAARVLLELGADPTLRTRNGSTPMVLATLNTGRSGSGSPEAKAQQLEILRLLNRRA
jgi:hypothetical protein